MKIAIFGGTGRTGKFLVEQALSQGFSVNLLARNPEKVDVHNEALMVIIGDVTDAAAVEKTIEGSQAVLSVLGPTGNKAEFAVSKGMENILSAMQKHGIKRLIITAGAGVGDPKDEPKLFNHVMNFLLKLMAKNVLADMSSVVDMVRASDRDWTVVRLPMLTDDPKSGQVKVGYVGKGMGPRITRADIADFMLSELTKGKHIHESPAISN